MARRAELCGAGIQLLVRVQMPIARLINTGRRHRSQVSAGVGIVRTKDEAGVEAIRDAEPAMLADVGDDGCVLEQTGITG